MGDQLEVQGALGIEVQVKPGQGFAPFLRRRTSRRVCNGVASVGPVAAYLNN